MHTVLNPDVLYFETYVVPQPRSTRRQNSISLPCPVVRADSLSVKRCALVLERVKKPVHLFGGWKRASKYPSFGERGRAIGG